MIEGDFENAPKINEKIVKKSTINVLIITIIILQLFALKKSILAVQNTCIKSAQILNLIIL